MTVEFIAVVTILLLISLYPIIRLIYSAKEKEE